MVVVYTDLHFNVKVNMDQNFVLSQLESLKVKGLVDRAFVNIKNWLFKPGFEEFETEIVDLIEAGEVEKLNNAFYKVIPFGTGGRRGLMGAGTNRINSRTIAESAQGYANYLIKTFGTEMVRDRGMVVTYDVRHRSLEYAEAVAGVFAANGIKVYFFDGVRSTPQISFSVRYLNAIAGAMISASHNPPSDNGIKIYWSTGGQVVPPHDQNIIDTVERVEEIKTILFEEAKQAGLVVFLEEDVDRAYHEAVGKLSLGDYRNVHIVFTPMHGCATTSFLPVLKHVGFDQIDEVSEQMPFDPDFSKVANQIPNPEIPISLEVAIDQAKNSKADIVLAADPDADRIGVVSRESYDNDEYVFLNGNQIGVLLFDYITRRRGELGNMPDRSVMVKTVVTTDLLTKIAEANGIETKIDLPVGFKFIAEYIDNQLDGREFIFGAEESHGYLYGDYARDKDGAIAALLICEYAALLKKEKRTIFEQLEFIKKKYGYYRELLQNIYYHGMDGMDRMTAIMDTLRQDMPGEIGGRNVVSVFDQQSKKVFDPKTGDPNGAYDGFANDALVFYLDAQRQYRVVVRPSGTEPKIKFYVGVGEPVGEEKSLQEYQKIKKEVDDVAHQLLEEIVSYADKISPGGEKFEILG